MSRQNAHAINVKTSRATHKWSRKHKFDACWSQNPGYWGLLS